MARRSTTKSRGGDISSAKKRIRFGIALKFALVVSILISVGMGTLGFIVYRSTRAALEESINRAGVFSAMVAAAPDWHHKDNQKRLKSMLSTTVLDVVICERNASGEYVKLIASAADKELQLKPLESLDDSKGVRIRRVRMTSSDGEPINCRSFRHIIYSTTVSSKPIAQVEVILSEEAIEDELDAITRSIIIITILGILAGIAISIIIGRQMTRPILTLVDDLGAISRGSYGRRTHVKASDEIGLLGRAFNSMAQGLGEGEEAKESLISKEHEEQIAQEIQEKLFPTALPQIEGADVKAVFQPASDISADLFDFIQTDKGKTGLLIMTASGKGIPAAIVLAMARSVFRAVAPSTEEPAEALRKINALFAPDLRRGMYVTALYVIYDSNSQTARVASAGHKLPAIHHISANDALQRIHPAGIAMGLDKGPVFDRSITENDVKLETGDTILIGSAGIVQLKLSSGEPIGEQRFFKLALGALRSDPANAAHKIVERIDEHVDDSEATADVALVTLTVS